MRGRILEDAPVPVRLRLSALWASVMFCYIYGDYFGLYRPGTLQGMLDGRMGPLGPTTQGVLLGTALLMAVPAAMVALSVLLPAVLARWSNVVFGLAYTAVMAVSLPGAWTFYIVLGVLEMLATLAIAVLAWRWPRTRADTEAGA